MAGCTPLSVRRGLSTMLVVLTLAGFACSTPMTEPTALPTATPRPPLLPYGEDLQRALDLALQQGQGSYALGVSAALIVPGYRTWVGVAGDSAPGIPIHADMLFNAGSVAKIFEAALALKLAEQGRLDLDAPVSTWLPAHPHIDGRITVRQLLNHTSGVFNVFNHSEFPWVGREVDYARRWQLDEVLARFVDQPYGAPGDAQRYSSTNYLLLTAILEAVSGHSVPDQIQDLFLDPLELDHVVISMGELPSRKFSIARPWADVDLDGEMDDLGAIPQTWVATLTHPVVYARPQDLAGWMHALYWERRVLAGRSLKEMLTIPAGSQPDPLGGSYGLGIVDFSELLEVPAIGHGGSSLGYSAAALYLPDHGVSLAWAINTGESPPTLADRLMRNTWTRLSQVFLMQVAEQRRSH